MTYLVRWLTLDFDNDYFMHVAWAAEMLRGEWPVRDFVEPGFPLQTLLSYAGLRLGGNQLWWEGGIACFAIAAGAAFTYAAGRRIGLRSQLALAAALLVLATFPRLYAYPKALAYPAGLWAIATFLDRPDGRSLFLLSGTTAMAFLLRHDHGVWLTIPVVLAIASVHRTDWKALLGSTVRYGLVAGLLVSPWLAWVAASGHAGQYFQFLGGQSQGLTSIRIAPDPSFHVDASAPLVTVVPVEYPIVGIRWAAAVPVEGRKEREARYGLVPIPDRDGGYRLTNIGVDNVRAIVADPAVEDTAGIDRGSLLVPSGLFTRLALLAQRYVPLLRLRVLPGVVNAGNAQTWLAWVSFLVPFLALAVSLLLAVRRRGEDVAKVPPAAALVAPAAVLGIVLYQTMVRGSPDTRLGDVAGVVALLLIWTSLAAWKVRGWPAIGTRPVVLVLLSLTAAAATAYGRVPGRLADAGVDGPINTVRRARDVGERWASRPLDVLAPPGTEGLAGLTRWLNECTGETDRVSVVGFEPQVFVLAERGFAGGMAFYDLAWNSSTRDQRLTVERWSRQTVPVVLAMVKEWDAFSRDYPIVRAMLDGRYERVRQSMFGGNKDVIVLVDRTRSSQGVHEPTGLPCFRAR